MSTKAARLGQWVRRRRDELDLSQLDVWQAGGPSNTTLTKIENGKLPSLGRTTARKLDAGLKWEQGSAKRVWEGGEPTPLLASTTARSQALREAIGSADVDDALRRRLLDEIDDYERGTG